MHERLESCRFLYEALSELLVFRELRVDDFDRALHAGGQRVLSPIDRSHTAGPQLLQESIASESLPL